MILFSQQAYLLIFESIFMPNTYHIEPPKGAKVIAFQGAYGAYSDMACRAAFPKLETLPCPVFEDAFRAVNEGKAQLAMIPVDNSLAGRVADIHHLLPEGGLHIIGEHFQRINHVLMGLKGTKLDEIKTAHSHVHALSQCRDFLRDHNIKPLIQADTAGSAAELQNHNDKNIGVIASSLAAEIYGLDILARDIEDAEHNTTRFFFMAPKPRQPAIDDKRPMITSFVFRVRNIPAALYKVMGGFATNGVNISKLESYLVDGRFAAAQFYAEAEGRPEDKGLKLALEELNFFAKSVKMMGTYPAHPFRKDVTQIMDEE